MKDMNRNSKKEGGRQKQNSGRKKSDNGQSGEQEKR